MQIVKPHWIIEDEHEIDGQKILKKIERFARTCYKSEGKITDTSAPEFVRKLFHTNKHQGIAEHYIVTVRFFCDRGVSHELVRHRIASYLQKSTRYCDEAKGEIAFVEPPGLNGYTKLMWVEAMTYAEWVYKALRKRGVKPEIARSVLPNALLTEVLMTANLRNWHHFFELRTAVNAHPQMRELTIPLLRRFQELIPVIFDDIDPTP